MSPNADCDSLQGLLFASHFYVNPRLEHKTGNARARLIAVLIIMLFFVLLISTVLILVRTAPVDRPEPLTTFSSNR